MGENKLQFITLPLSFFEDSGIAKTALSLPQLVQQTNQFSAKYIAGCVPQLLDSSPKELFLHYRVTCSKSDSDPNGHEVRLQFDVSKVQETSKAKDLDIQLNCSCPAFNWWSAAYNLHSRDSLLGTPLPGALNPPTERLDLRGNYVLCVAPGSRVWMADGTEKSIEDVKVGDSVVTHRGRPRRVTATLERSSAPGEKAISLRSKGVSIPLVVSEDHPLAAVRGNQTCFCGCKESLPYHYKGVLWDRKYLPGHSPNKRKSALSLDAIAEIRSSTETQYALAAAYGISKGSISRIRRKEEIEYRDDPEVVEKSSGELCWVSKHDGLSKYDYLYFPKMQWQGTTKSDPVLASILGYYLAEGDLVYRKRKKTKTGKFKKTKSCSVMLNGDYCAVYGVRFTLNRDEEFTIAKDIVTKLRKLSDSDIVVTKQEHDGNKWMTVTIWDSPLAVRLLELGGCGSANKRISEEAWNWNWESIQELLGAYALGDGHFDENGGQYIYSISYALISQISTILFALGVWNGRLYQDWQGAKAKDIKKKHRYHRLYWDYRNYPQVLGLIESRLRAHVLDRVRSAPTYTRGSDYWEDGFLRNITKLETIPAPAKFYDLTVEDDESFIVNGVVVHNCKHVQNVANRVLPAVQHNIVKILRERTVKEHEEEIKKTPERLRKDQERMKKRKEVERIRKVKDKDIQEKLLDALRRKEEGRLRHEQELDEQQGTPAATPEPPAWMKLPEHYQPQVPVDEAEELAALNQLYEEEQERIEEKHRKGEPHTHKGLPYPIAPEKDDEEEDEGWQGQRVSSEKDIG